MYWWFDCFWFRFRVGWILKMAESSTWNFLLEGSLCAGLDGSRGNRSGWFYFERCLWELFGQKGISGNVRGDFFVTFFYAWIRYDDYVLIQPEGLVCSPVSRGGHVFLQSLIMNFLTSVKYVNASILQPIRYFVGSAPCAN